MKYLLSLCLFLSLIGGVLSQNVTILPTGIKPEGGIPRLNYEAILSLPNPQKGDLAYDLSFDVMRMYNGSKWIYFLTSQNLNQPAITAWGAGGTSNDRGSSVAVDRSGNVYVTGFFWENMRFGNINFTSRGYSDLFIAKYNKNGVLQWVQQAGGTSYDYGNAIATDSSGNVYVTGVAQGWALFGTNTYTNDSNHRFFIAKYDENGTLQWVKRGGDVSGLAMCTDKNNNVYITGNFYGTPTLSTATLTSKGSSDFFVAKYNPDGTLEWVLDEGGSSNDIGKAIAVDGNNNIFIMGTFEETVSLGSNVINSAGSEDFFVAKYSNNGLIDWSWSAGGSGSDSGNAIAVDKNGDLYIAGTFTDTVSFASAWTTLTSEGQKDVFILKYHRLGWISWAKKAGGPSSDFVNAITLDSNGYFYVAGTFAGTIDFGGSVLNTAGVNDIYVAKHDSNGLVQWVQRVGGTGSDIALSATMDSKNNFYVTGFYLGEGVFGNTVITSNGIEDMFIARIKD